MPNATWTVPNVLTALRLVLVPVFVALHLSGRPGWALVCFLTAAFTDSLDGFLARLLHQQSKLGAILDPLADKLLTGFALLLLVLERHAPAWLLVLILSRDAAMALGAAWVRRKGLDVPTAPSRIGKYATFALSALVVLGLLDESVGERPLLHAWYQVAGWLAGVCVVVSTAQYVVRWGWLWVAPARRGAS